MLPTPKRVKRSTQHVDDIGTDAEGWGGAEICGGGVQISAGEGCRNPHPFIEQSSLEQSVENNPLPAVRWRERPVTSSLTKEVSLPEPKRLSSTADVTPPRERTREGVSLGSPHAFDSYFPPLACPLAGILVFGGTR